MPKTKEQKQKIIEELKEKIGREKSMVFVDYQGLKVKELFDLRKRLKKAGAMLVITKRTLLELAFKEKKIKIEKDKLSGQLGIIFGFEDEFMPAKLVHQFSQESPNLKILCGYFENQLRDAPEVIALAKLPARQELLAQLAGSISAPISGFLNVLQGSITALLYALNAIKQTK